MRDKLKSEFQSLVTLFISGEWLKSEFLRAVFIPTAVLLSLSLVERWFSHLLLPNRGLGFLYFIPIWLAVKMGYRSAGIFVSLFTAIALQTGAPEEAHPIAIVVNFVLLTLVTFVFYEVGQNIARTRKMATTDPLTGLLTRRGFQMEASRGISALHLQKETGAIVLFDCDKFKTINDQLGHAKGDDALRIIAKALRGATNQDDVVARLGGDEFLVFLPGTDTTGANIFLSRVKHLVQEISGDFPIPIRLSAGISFFPAEARELQTLIDIADEKMFRQKRARSMYTHTAIDEEARKRARA